MSARRAESIDGVLRELEAIIAWSLESRSPIGYFASLYLRVTKTIKSKIGTGFFDDDARLERLDVNFANRYFEALEQFRAGDSSLLPSWALSFQACQRQDLIVVQHLLDAMNPHINIDLGVATAETAPGDQIAGIKGDFEKVNLILASLVPTVLRQVGSLSPLIHLLDDVAGKDDDEFINFSMRVSRDFAWDCATELAPLAQAEWPPLIDKRDVFLVELGHRIISPGIPLQWLVDIVRAPETRNVDKVINTLNTGDRLPLEPDRREPAEPETAPNRIYYFEVGAGDWTGTFTFKLKSWKELWLAPIGLKNRFLVVLMTLFQKIFGDSSMSSTIIPRPDEGEFGVAWNDFRIHKGRFTLFRSKESYTLSPNGTGVRVDADVSFGPVSFLFREHDSYPASILDGGMRAVYDIELLGSRFLGKYSVAESRKQVSSVLENAFAEVDEVLKKAH